MARAQQFIAYRFQVQGSGSFPVDMLRYDRAVPDSQDDITRAFVWNPTGSNRVERLVSLIAYAPRGYAAQPTADRWASFGWRVVAGSIKRVEA